MAFLYNTQSNKAIFKSSFASQLLSIQILEVGYKINCYYLCMVNLSASTAAAVIIQHDVNDAQRAIKAQKKFSLEFKTVGKAGGLLKSSVNN